MDVIFIDTTRTWTRGLVLFFAPTGYAKRTTYIFSIVSLANTCAMEVTDSACPQRIEIQKKAFSTVEAGSAMAFG